MTTVDVPAVDAPEEPAGGDRLRTARRWAGDLTALAVLLVVFVWWTEHDGGRAFRPLVLGGTIALAAVPVALVEIRRLPRTARLLLAAWGIGLLLAVGFAQERGGMVRPLMAHGLLGLTLLSTLRIWRRRWGPAALVGILLVALGRYWYRGFLQWWGGTMLEDGSPSWLALSWRNQSAALMGGLATLLTGGALLTRRVVSLGFGLAAAASLGTVFLTGSRAGTVMVVVALGLTVAAAAAAQAPSAGSRWRTIGGRTAAIVLGAAAIVVVLTAMTAGGTGGGQPLANRDQAATLNALARLRHMEAAAGMFAHQPVTGQGLGSYRTMALEHTSPDANLTSSAHNEYVEMLGETGALGGLPFIALALGAAWLVLERLRPRRDVEPAAHPDAAALRAPLTAGAAGTVALLLAHAAVDFDFDYPVLPALLAAGAAILIAERPRLAPDRHAARAGWALAAVPIALVLAAGSATGLIELDTGSGQQDLSAEEYARAPVPWDHRRAVDHATVLLDRGEVAAARTALERTAPWNPGVDTIRIMEAIVDYRAGAIGAQELAASIDLGRTRFALRRMVAEQLRAGGDHAAALTVADELLADLETYERWGVSRTAMETILVRIWALSGLDRCGEVEAWLPEALAHPAVESFENGTQVVRDAVAELCPDIDADIEPIGT